MNRFLNHALRKYAREGEGKVTAGTVASGVLGAGLGGVGGLFAASPATLAYAKNASTAQLRVANAAAKAATAANRRAANLLSIKSGKAVPLHGNKTIDALKQSGRHNLERVKTFSNYLEKLRVRNMKALAAIAATGALAGGTLGAIGGGKLYNKLTD